MPPARIVFFAATIAGIGITVRALMTEPPPLPVSIAFVVAYFAILLSGVFVLRLRMFADAVIRGPADARGVALTFDDGPHPEHTREVLDVLDAHDAKATFFVIGHKAEKHPELVTEIVRRGHEVGVHGFAHERLFSLRGTKHVRADLHKAIRVLENITGKTPALFRPPIGHTNPTIARVADELDLTVIGWSASARDGVAWTKPDDVVTRVTGGLRDGAIVLLHDASERTAHKPAGVTALPAILEKIAARNLVVAHLPDWLAEDETSQKERRGGAESI